MVPQEKHGDSRVPDPHPKARDTNQIAIIPNTANIPRSSDQV